MVNIEQEQLQKMQEDFDIIFHDKIAGNESLNQKWLEVKQSEIVMKAQFETTETEMKERWKRDIDEIADENTEIEEAWKDLRDKECECDDLLKTDSLSEQEKDEIVLEKERLVEAKSLLKLEEEKVATRERKVLDAIEIEMDRWEVYKKKELHSIKEMKKDLVKECGISDLDALSVKIDEQEQKIVDMIHDLKEQDGTLAELEKQYKHKKIDLLQEKEDFLRERESLSDSQCKTVIELEKDIIGINEQLNDMDVEMNDELNEIREERER